MAKINGTNLLVYVDNVAVALSTSCTINISADMIDATTKGSAGWKNILPGLKEWSIDCDALVDFTQSEGFSQGFADLSGRTQVVVKFQTTTTGDKIYSGNAYRNSLTANAPMEDVVSYSTSFSGNGALSETTVT